MRVRIALAVLCALLGAVVGVRPIGTESALGRQLLDINVGTTSQSFTITAFGTGNTPGGQCYIQGFPGSRADSVVSGPLNVNVTTGTSLTIGFSRASDTYFQNYNYSGFTNETTLNQNSSYGLASVVFSPTGAGHYVNTFSGLISGSNPITQPTCLVSINLLAVAPPPPPSPPPTPPSTGCTGAIPCYCQNGYCFNNGATLSTNCAAPGGQSCVPTTINPASIGIQYASGYPSSVNVCKCTATSG